MKARIRGAGASGASEAASPPLNVQRNVPGIERLSVYTAGYQVRIQEALAEVYEAVRHVAGESAFAELSRAYAGRYPSQDYNLSFTGRHFPEFLRCAPLTQRLPFLPDLAMLEWAVCEAFHAFQQPPVTPDALTTLSLEDWTNARLLFQPSVRVVESAWPIVDIWEARARPRDEVSIELVDRPQRVLVFRHELQVRCSIVEAPHAALLNGLLAGRTLGELCAELAGRFTETPLPIADWCAQWMQAGLIVAVNR